MLFSKVLKALTLFLNCGMRSTLPCLAFSPKRSWYMAGVNNRATKRETASIITTTSENSARFFLSSSGRKNTIINAAMVVRDAANRARKTFLFLCL